MSSKSRRVMVFTCIDKILKNEEDFLDSNLNRFIEAIDDLLFREKENTEIQSKKGKINCNEEKMDLNVFEKWENTIESVGEKILDFCENNSELAVDVLECIGHLHWAGVGFVLVASVLKKWNAVKYNKKECLRLLKSMNDLAKVVLELRPLPYETANTQAKIKESIHTILRGATSCSKMMERNRVNGLVKSKKDKRELLEVRQEIEELRSILHVHISVCIFKRICKYEKECGGMEDFVTNVELENEEDLSEGSPKNDKRGTKHVKAFGKRSRHEAFTQIEGISKNEEGSNKRFRINDDNKPNTPSPSKAKASQ